ncbi:MAG TPA: lysophospholipid acyltransferase family protein [Methylomirabilota bacterium]|nr:lysophospholipid acyltransferase family protein [Methylomirabilota bacterium]
MRRRTPVLDLWRPAFHAACRAYFRLELRGTRNIPRDGGLLIIPNHQTYADPPLVTIPVRRPVYYMAWSRLFDIPLFNRLIRLLRAFPVDIEARDSRATREALRLLKAGAALMIFPEGGRTPDGRVQHFKAGAFRLAVAVDVPVLPVTIVGGDRAWPPGRILPRPRRITITYHPLLRARPARDSRAAARDLADRTRASILSAMPEGGRQAPRSSTE